MKKTLGRVSARYFGLGLDVEGNAGLCLAMQRAEAEFLDGMSELCVDHMLDEIGRRYTREQCRTLYWIYRQLPTAEDKLDFINFVIRSHPETLFQA